MKGTKLAARLPEGGGDEQLFREREQAVSSDDFFLHLSSLLASPLSEVFYLAHH